MTNYLAYTMGFLLLPGLWTPQVVKANAELQEVTTYLETKYDEFLVDEQGNIAVFDLSFVTEWTVVKQLRSPPTRTYLPTVHFYTTELQTAGVGRGPVPVLVAVVRSSDGVDVRAMLSPVYSDPSQKFLHLFSGVRAESNEDKTRVSEELAKLISLLTEDPDVAKGRVTKQVKGWTSSATIRWSNRPNWIEVIVAFSNESEIEQVDVIRRAGRPAEWLGNRESKHP